MKLIERLNCYRRDKFMDVSGVHRNYQVGTPSFEEVLSTYHIRNKEAIAHYQSVLISCRRLDETQPWPAMCNGCIGRSEKRVIEPKE